MNTTSISLFAGLMDIRQALIGTLCLLLGVLVYVTARPEGVLFLPEALNFGGHFPVILTKLTGSLPVFLHVLGLSLLTASVVTPSKPATIIICLSWAFTNAVFECGQHPAVYTWLSTRLAAGAQDIWLLQLTLKYFRNGTFDPADIAVSLLAAVIAYLVIRRTTREVHP